MRRRRSSKTLPHRITCRRCADGLGLVMASDPADRAGALLEIDLAGIVANWRLPAILHVDTGMARLGLTKREFEELATGPPKQGAIHWRGLISHLACADDPAHPLNEVQRARFSAARQQFGDVPASLAASSGIFL